MSLTPQTPNPTNIPTVYVMSSRGVIGYISATGPVRVVVMDYDDRVLFPCEWEAESPDLENFALWEQLIVDRETPESDRTPEQIARLAKHENAW